MKKMNNKGMNKKSDLGFLGLIIVIIFASFTSFIWANPDEFKSMLKRSFDLVPRYKAGDKDFYHIKTTYLDLDDVGKVAKTSVINGYFTREVIRTEDGKHVDDFIWKHVKRLSKNSKGEILEDKILPYTMNFQYQFGEWTYEKFPVDLSSIPKTMEGWIFVVNLIDAHTFDIIVGLDKYKKKIIHVGDMAVLPGEGVPISMDFPPLFTDSYFKNSPFHIKFLGLTIYKDEPCAILDFRADDCSVHLVVNMNDMKLPTDGVSYYSGKVFLSLKNHRILWGEMIERVDFVTDVGNLGKPLRQSTLREIVLERMDRKDYEKIGMESVDRD